MHNNKQGTQQKDSKVQHLYKGMCVLVLIGLTTMLAACHRSIPSNFYTLTPKISPLVNSNIKLIEVVPVGLPERLNTSLMVIQDPDGQSYQLDSQRWTSSLSNELQSALSAGLQQKLGAIDIYNTGLTGGQVAYMIATEFSRFDIVKQVQPKQTDIEVVAAWIVKPKYPQQALNSGLTAKQLNCRMVFKNTVSGDGENYLNIVQTYQDSLQRVTEAIAQSTLAVENKKLVNIESSVCNFS